MSDSATISSAPPARVSMNYSALREGGMELIRKWAAQSWTDHNLHDPGITMLEACSYAITELGLRVQLNVNDLLRSGASNRVPDLVPAHRVLPAGPVNPIDLRNVLLDHPLVSDAQIFLPAESEVQFYELPGGNPPLTYAPGTARIRPGGLYEVLIELSGRDLDTNTYSFQVSSGGQNYAVDLALPFWDEPEAAPFRQGAAVTAVAMVPDGATAWRALPESQSFFGKLDISYTTAAGPDHVVTWALLQITTVLARPAAVVPGILAAVRSAVESAAANAPVLQFADRARRAAAAVNQIQSYLSEWRNLGEQAVRIGVARVQEIAVRARIEVTGGIDLEQLLAGIFADLDLMLSPRVQFQSLATRVAAQPDPSQIYDGPLLRNGFLATQAVAAHPAVLFLSDVLRSIMRHRTPAGSDVVTQENPAGRDIVAVIDLALTNYINNRPITSDADDCLQLVEIQRYRPRLSIAKSRIVFVRNDSEVAYDLGRVQQLFTTLQQTADQGSRTADTSPLWPVQQGDLLPVQDYTPVQEELPAIYGAGHSELPDSAGLARLAAVKQLQGYLLLFEQILGDVTTQLGNINRFFSGDAGEDTTYFTRPPFDLPGVRNLLRRFPLSGDWNAFINDPANPVTSALHAAAETRTEMLDRRNRMLDHLLARQGEDMVAFGQELHRWAQLELAAANLPAAQQAAATAGRRDAANARLIRLKAGLLKDAPELNAFRLLANSNPLFGDANLLQITPSGAPFAWHLSPDNQEQLRSPATFATAAQAHIAAENALALAGRPELYAVFDIGGGQRRLHLMDGTSAAAQLVAESTQTFVGDAAATAGAATIASLFAQLLKASSPSPFERLIAFQTGIRIQQRRTLLSATSGNFQIVDDPPGGALFGKRWRLFENPGNTGPVLLNNPVRFDAATDALATQLAQDSIRQVLRYGMDEWNYVITPATGSTFTYQLQDPSGVILAVRDAALASAAAAATALTATVRLLYRAYSAEGFYLIEHLLLRPRQTGDPFLSLPTAPANRERDPYSQRISLIIPSGSARDFSLPRQTAPTTPVTPDRFRDPEFRSHAERTIEQACPAHLMPVVFWVDQSLPNTPASPASFDTFEQRYLAWLDTVLIPGAPAATPDGARKAMVDALNAIANDTP
jgi:hypothetical protein